MPANHRFETRRPEIDLNADITFNQAEIRTTSGVYQLSGGIRGIKEHNVITVSRVDVIGAGTTRNPVVTRATGKHIVAPTTGDERAFRATGGDVISAVTGDESVQIGIAQIDASCNVFFGNAKHAVGVGTNLRVAIISHAVACLRVEERSIGRGERLASFQFEGGSAEYRASVT